MLESNYIHIIIFGTINKNEIVYKCRRKNDAMSQALMTLHRVPEFFILGYGRNANWTKFSAFSHRLGPLS